MSGCLIIPDKETAKAMRELFGISEQLEASHEKDHVADPGKMVGDLIGRQEAIDAYITNCPYFSGKNTIDRSVYGTHIGACSLEYHYEKICPSPKCLCAEGLGLKDE